MNIDMNLAPVMDVDTNPANPVIGDRSFSREPATVARMGAAFTRALQAEGVAACAKHFPGHGDTSQDRYDIIMIQILVARVGGCVHLPNTCPPSPLTLCGSD